jgi:hypothetical protein
MASRYNTNLAWSLDGQPVEIEALIAANKGDKAVEKALGKLIEEAHAAGFKAQVAKIGKHTVTVRQGFPTWSQLLDRTSLRSRNPRGMGKMDDTKRQIAESFAERDSAMERQRQAAYANEAGYRAESERAAAERAAVEAAAAEKAAAAAAARAAQQAETDAAYAALANSPVRQAILAANASKAAAARAESEAAYRAQQESSRSSQQQQQQQQASGPQSASDVFNKYLSGQRITLDDLSRVQNPRTPNHHRTGILSEDYPADPYRADLPQHFDPYDRDGRMGNPGGTIKRRVDYDFLSEFVSENFGKDPNFTKDERGRRVRATSLMTDEESAAYHARWRENYLGLLARIATLLDSNPQYMDELANTLQDTANQIGKRVVVERHTNDKAGWPRNRAWVEVKATFDGPAKDHLTAFNGWLERGIKEALNRVESNPLPHDRDGRMGNPGKSKYRGMVFYNPHADDNHVVVVSLHRITPALVRALTGQTVSKKYCRYIADRMKEYWLENDYGAKHSLASLAKDGDDANVEPEMKKDSISIAVTPGLLREVWNQNRRPLHPCANNDLLRVADYIEKHYFTSDNGGYELVREAMENTGVWYGKTDNRGFDLYLVQDGDLVTGLVGTRNAHGVMVDQRAVVTSRDNRVDYMIAADGAGGVVPLTQPNQNTDKLHFPLRVLGFYKVGQYPWVSRQMSWYGQDHFPAIGVQDSFGTLGVLVGFSDEEGNGAAPLVVTPT